MEPLVYIRPSAISHWSDFLLLIYEKKNVKGGNIYFRLQFQRFGLLLAGSIAVRLKQS